MSDTDNYKLVTEKAGELGALYTRMDKTRDQLYLTPYVLKDAQEREIKDGISVTTNRPAVFANAIISDLMGAKWQTVVEGEISDKKAYDIETFLESAFAQADERLKKRGENALYPWLCNHVCHRSIIGARWIVKKQVDTFTVDCLAVDMRWTPWEWGNDGLAWVGPITFRNGGQVLDEYPEAEGMVKREDKNVEVVPFWNSKVNQVFVKGQLAFEQANPYGYPPFVISYPSTGFMFKDQGYMERWAEDILFLSRNLYDEVSRIMSMEQTASMDALRPGYEQLTPVDRIGELPDKPADSGQTARVAEPHTLVPHGEMSNASVTARQDIQAEVKQGSINTDDLAANVTQTALWITTQTEIRHKVIIPRLECLTSFYEQSARMIISQTQMIQPDNKEELKVGITGRKQKFSADKLGDPDTYTITYRLMTQSKQQEVANEARAAALWGREPDIDIYKNVLMVDDPDGMLRRMELQRAEQGNLIITKFNQAFRYAEEADECEDEVDAEAKRAMSKMLTEECVTLIQNEGGQTPAPEAAQSKPNANALAGLAGPAMKAL